MRLILLTVFISFLNPQLRWKGDGGKVSFTSDAPLELIQAESNSLRGVIESSSGKFAFTVETASFHGFNSALQQEHFHENYMESNKYPTASFSGRFIEDINSLGKGEHQVRAKGNLKIHGVIAERIIKCNLVVNDNSVVINSSFLVPLDEHNITIPQVVYQKIAEEIQVSISLKMDI